MLLSGCDSTTTTSATADTAGSGDCAKLAAVKAPDSAATTALVVDNTASGVLGPVPPAIREAIADAQGRGNRLEIIPVDGAGRPGRISRTVALDPAPGKRAQTAVNARSIVLDCVGEWIREPAARPGTPGSDILAAITAAGREKPATILVISDGLTNAGEFDLGKDGFDADPRQVADGLAASGSLTPTLRGSTVVWSGLGSSAAGLTPSLTSAVQSLWTAVLAKAGAKATFDPRAGGSTAPPTGDLPADPLPIPSTARRTTPCGEQIVVPAALLFSPGKANLHDDAAPILQQTADDLTAHPDWVAVVEGHTANYDTAGRRAALSRDRAQAVVDALAKLKVDAGRLVPKGYGATRPAVPEIRNGTHDRVAAAKNRRVVLNLGPKGCVH
jgi:outer membrane protein OmpA-like peptidoglycan-associated protein